MMPIVLPAPVAPAVNLVINRVEIARHERVASIRKFMEGRGPELRTSLLRLSSRPVHRPLEKAVQ